MSALEAQGWALPPSPALRRRGEADVMGEGGRGGHLAVACGFCSPCARLSLPRLLHTSSNVALLGPGTGDAKVFEGPAAA